MTGGGRRATRGRRGLARSDRFSIFLSGIGECIWSPRQESNLYLALRRRLFYPLNYGESPVRGSAYQRRERDGDVDSAQSIANARRIGGRNACRYAPRALTRVGNPESEIDDDKIFLAHVAQRAAPVGGNVGETGAGGDALVGQAFCFVVYPPANQADPALVFGYFAHVVLGMMKIRDAVRSVAGG